MDKLKNLFSTAAKSVNADDMLPLVLAVAALVVAFIPPIAWIAVFLVILALIVGLMKKQMGANPKLSIAAIIIAILALVVSFVLAPTTAGDVPETEAGSSPVVQGEP